MMIHPTGDRASTPGLIGDAIRQATELFATEIALVRLEATEKLTMVVASLVSLVAAAIFIIVALIFLLQGLVEVLIHVGLQPYAASFAVGGGIALIAVVAIVVAMRNLSGDRLKPKRTLGQVDVASKMVRGRAP